MSQPSAPPPGNPPGSPPGGKPPGSPGAGPGRFEPGQAAPADLKFKIFDDPVTLDAGMLRSAAALLMGKPVSPALAALINDNRQIQEWIEGLLANYPVHIAAIFLIASGYILHAGALKQTEMRNMISSKGRTQ